MMSALLKYFLLPFLFAGIAHTSKAYSDEEIKAYEQRVRMERFLEEERKRSVLERKALEQQQKRTIEMLFFGLFMSIPVGIYAYHRTRAKKVEKEWSKGYFGKNIEFDRDHLVQAYIRLGALMIDHERKDAKEKFHYMVRYFHNYFPNHDVHFGDAISFAFRHPVNLHSVSSWIKHYLPKRSYRLHVIYFLAGLAFIDGRIIQEEIKLLRSVNELLGLNEKELNSILAMYRRSEEEHFKQRQRRAYRTPSTSELKRCSEILGVSEAAAMDEIKKAYRRLVKIHHPDRLIDVRGEQLRIAKEKFIRIQQAYEYLERVKRG